MKKTDANFDILVVGELNVDVLLNDVQKLPQVGEEILAGQMSIAIGGSSAIFACNAQAIGSSVAFASKIGEDQFGKFILQELAQKKVAIPYVQVSDADKTGVSFILNYAEDRAIVTYPGAMATFGLDDIPEEAFQQARHLHVSSLFIQPRLKGDAIELFKKAKTYNMTTSLDPQWDPAEQWELDWKTLLRYVDVFLPNRVEIQHISGKTSIEEGITALAPYSTIIVVKNGSNGSVVHANGKSTSLPAFKNSTVVDAIGAGDSFDAGFIHSFIKSSELIECQRFANLCGALNTTAAGGTGAFGDKEAMQEGMRRLLGSKDILY